MKKHGILAMVTAVLLLFSGCTEIVQESDSSVSIATQTTVATETTVVEQSVAQYDAVSLQVPEITRQDFSLTLEAEDADAPEHCSVTDTPRQGYSGTGYLHGLSANYAESVTLEAEIPTTQHYDITIVAGSNAACTCKIMANGETVYTLVMDSSETFLRVTIQGIFLTAGDCALTIEPEDGILDVDCVELVNNTSLYDASAELDDAPVDENASDSAKELFQFLKASYGEKIITGQYVSDETDAELDTIYQTTGKYPLIRFDDIGGYMEDGDDSPLVKETVIEQSLAWAEKGGIVGLCWYWDAPAETASVYATETTFSLEDAVTDLDVALCTDQELLELKSAGEISAECYALIADIDAVSEALQLLAQQDVAVLWRPLMEAGGAWYWWGASGAEAYVWLWNLMYTRMTEYHGLHNLLWVWNGQSASYLVDDAQYDIASLDLYVEEDEEFGSRYEQYVALRNMTPGKMLAISECSTMPDMNAMFRDNAVWSFFGLWYSPYLDTYTSEETLIAVYNSEAALTLGDFTTE